MEIDGGRHGIVRWWCTNIPCDNQSEQNSIIKEELGYTAMWQYQTDEHRRGHVKESCEKAMVMSVSCFSFRS